MKDDIVNGTPLRCYDDGGASADRYTVVFIDCPESRNLMRTFCALGMNESPFHPQGFGQHCSATPGRHLGKRIRFIDLPVDCRQLVRMDTARM